MDSYRAYQKRVLGIIIVLAGLTGIGIGFGILKTGEWLVLFQGSVFESGSHADQFEAVLNPVNLVMNSYSQWIIPSAIGICIVLGIISGFIVIAGTAGLFNSAKNNVTVKSETKLSKKDFIDHKIEQERKRRLFLHTLSVLQREGRLLDFFAEDLSLYEDAQIGAAVRSIQEDCKKAMKKYIDPRPVLEGEEGDEVTVEEGFDIDAINLVGNVAGQPPFKGVIRHPGWKAGKNEVPKLSDIQDPGIMTPAEVEIQ